MPGDSHDMTAARRPIPTAPARRSTFPIELPELLDRDLVVPLCVCGLPEIDGYPLCAECLEKARNLCSRHPRVGQLVARTLRFQGDGHVQRCAWCDAWHLTDPMTPQESQLLSQACHRLRRRGVEPPDGLDVNNSCLCGALATDREMGLCQECRHMAWASCAGKARRTANQAEQRAALVKKVRYRCQWCTWWHVGDGISGARRRHLWRLGEHLCRRGIAPPTMTYQESRDRWLKRNTRA
jgi:hypothetical protein